MALGVFPGVQRRAGIAIGPIAFFRRVERQGCRVALAQQDICATYPQLTAHPFPDIAVLKFQHLGIGFHHLPRLTVDHARPRHRAGCRVTCGRTKQGHQCRSRSCDGQHSQGQPSVSWMHPWKVKGLRLGSPLSPAFQEACHHDEDHRTFYEGHHPNPFMDPRGHGSHAIEHKERADPRRVPGDCQHYPQHRQHRREEGAKSR